MGVPVYESSAGVESRIERGYGVSDLTRWDRKWFKIALEVESWSKHPTTRVGCVIVDNDNVQLSGGYNGLPRGVDDSKIRTQSVLPRTNSVTVHAEANAVAAAARKGHALLGATAYVTRPVCCQCAALLIQAGIYTVRALHARGLTRLHEYGDWAENLIIAKTLLSVLVGQYHTLENHEYSIYERYDA